MDDWLRYVTKASLVLNSLYRNNGSFTVIRGEYYKALSSLELTGGYICWMLITPPQLRHLPAPSTRCLEDRLFQF